MRLLLPKLFCVALVLISNTGCRSGRGPLLDRRPSTTVLPSQYTQHDSSEAHNNSVLSDSSGHAQSILPVAHSTSEDAASRAVAQSMLKPAKPVSNAATVPSAVASSDTPADELSMTDLPQLGRMPSLSASLVQQVAFAEEAEEAEASQPGLIAPQRTVIPVPALADPGAQTGGPRYPKQQLPLQQSFLGQGGALPIQGMILGQIPGNFACGPAGSCGPAGMPAASSVGALPLSNCGNNWRPEGLACPWPADEYLCDGGDRDAHVRVLADWSATGVDLEDTVGHFDTLDGRVVVEPSNRVCIYAPRFSAVRRVDGLFSGDQHQQVNGIADRIGPKGINEKLLVGTDTQPLAPIGEIGRKRVTTYDGSDRGIPLAHAITPLAAQDRVTAAGDFLALSAVRLDESQKPFLAKKSLAAIVWTSEQMVQAVIDGVKAQADTGSQGVQIVYRVETGKPRLRVIKAASHSTANPGDEIQFVLRFDNIGQQPIGNVTLIDSLTTRLEYVPDSQQCSLTSKFGTQQNDGESLVLRWEINEPIKAGDGGVIVFKCKVR